MNEWTKVKYKMPETYVPVICKGTLDGEESIFSGWWDSASDLEDWYCFPMNWCSCCRQPETVVTHWMPYPESGE